MKQSSQRTNQKLKKKTEKTQPAEKMESKNKDLRYSEAKLKKEESSFSGGKAIFLNKDKVER
eukprot:snap_masked-scaffold_99-processed-gene-0.15-mRNA-1 protein AED:1.00 eAED:1.00 QI:0/0/0/0/1/1/2/0/61